MYKNLLRFSILVLIVLILSSLYILIYFNNQSNTIFVEENQYVKILKEVHDNIDAYIGKKFIISGYVYAQDDFSENRFVIAQDVYINNISPDEPLIVGFLCENRSNIDIIPNEVIKIKGILDVATYNGLEYPIILVDKIN